MPGDKAVKVSVFMSLFDVHVNRIPAGGRISRISYRPGAFLPRTRQGFRKNEQNAVFLDTTGGSRIVFVQIAGLIARRIACWVGEGDEVAGWAEVRPDPVGSRVDVYLPEGAVWSSQPGHNVKAGKKHPGYLP